MDKNKIGARIQAEKNRIIKMYKDGTDIIDLAEEYNVLAHTICMHMHRWGVKIKKGDYQRKRAIVEGKLRISPELQMKRDYNTMINSTRIKFIKGNADKDKMMIKNILLD